MSVSGYALTSGEFKVMDANVAVGIPNFYSTTQGHFGKVRTRNNYIRSESKINYMYTLLICETYLSRYYDDQACPTAEFEIMDVFIYTQ